MSRLGKANISNGRREMKAILKLGKLKGEFEIKEKPPMFYEMVLPKNEMKARVLGKGEEFKPENIEAVRLIFELEKFRGDMCFYSYRRMEEA